MLNSGENASFGDVSNPGQDMIPQIKADTQPANLPSVSPRSCEGCEGLLIGLCAPLGKDALAAVSDSGDIMTFKARETLFGQGDAPSHVFILHEGTARLTHLLQDGRQTAVGLRFGGDLLGFTLGSEHHFSAEALTPMQVCRIARRDFDALLRHQPKLERHFLDICARELAMTQDHLISLARFTAEERVAAFLMSLAEALECRGHRGSILVIPATRADLGELLGLTLETVSRTMGAFKRRGWLRPHGQHGVELLDRAALAALAAGDTAKHAPV